MPLDKRVFLREMAVLAELFNRPQLSDPLIARYYEYLNTRMTTDEFEAAARRIFEEERYWPAPITFLHAAKGDPQLLAREEWDRLLTQAAQGQLAELSAAGRKALAALGGWPRIAYAQEGALPSLRKAFLESYTTDDHTPPIPQLQAATEI